MYCFKYTGSSFHFAPEHCLDLNYCCCLELRTHLLVPPNNLKEITTSSLLFSVLVSSLTFSLY